MPCYWPLAGFRGKVLPSGKRAIVFRKSEAAVDLADPRQPVPCGQCIGCRLERSRQWALRCLNETQLHDRNCMVCLTFSDPHLPPGGDLDVKPLQLFLKRLRKLAGDVKIKFFACGEYGEKKGRPHFHVLLFNWDFADKVLYTVRNDIPVYRSETLERLWSDGKTGESLGISEIGSVTFESAAYVARYILKRELVLDKRFEDEDGKKWDVVARTGEIRKPEFVVMSRGGRGGRGGIGREWYEKFKLDMYPEDFYIVRGRKVKPPRYYDGLYELDSPREFLEVKSARKSRVDPLDNDSFRLPVKEACKRDSLKLLERRLEAIS